DRPTLEARAFAVRDQALALRVKGHGQGWTDRQGGEELVALAGGRQVPEVHTLQADRGHEPTRGADGDPARRPLVAGEGAALAAGGDLPAVIQRLVVRAEGVLVIHAPGLADQLPPGQGVPQPVGRIPAGAEEEVAAVAEAQGSDRRKVPLQGPQRPGRVRRVPEVDVLVKAAGRWDLAVAPPRQAGDGPRVVKSRDRFAAVQVPELKGAAAEDGPPAA